MQKGVIHFCIQLLLEPFPFQPLVFSFEKHNTKQEAIVNRLTYKTVLEGQLCIYTQLLYGWKRHYQNTSVIHELVLQDY